MTIVTESAWAKLNLTLDVLGKRPDGYHDLKSVMQTVTLCDDIILEIGTGDPWQLCCQAEGVPCDRRNLAWRAAEVFFEEANLDPQGLRITILKRIPSQAGMGGGSSDAAAVLRGLNRHYGFLFSREKLTDLGAKVGSDVPFCVLGGTAMAEGRGERLRSLKAIPQCSIVIVKPDFPVSTPALFQAIDHQEIQCRPDNDAMEMAIDTGNLQLVGKLLCNVFEPVVSRSHPEIRYFRDVALAHGALGCQMTGSGSACFAILETEKAARALERALEGKFTGVFLAKPV